MKIGLVRRGYSSTGGAERFLLRFAEGLRGLGHEAVLFSDCAWPESAWDSSQSKSVRLSMSDKALAPVAFANALEAVKPKQHCDFLFSFERVWTCDAYRAGDGVHQAWLERRSHFEASLKTWFRGKQKKHRELLELEASLYSPESGIKIVANSQMVKKEISDLYGLPEDRIVVIANGYDAEVMSSEDRLQMRKEKRAKLGLGDDEQAILFAGSGWERKGLAFAMQAYEAFRRGRKARLIVAGKGNKPRVISDEGVIFLGGVDSLTAVYEAADVFVLPTLYDPFSNACLEAAAHGLPVVTTTANGFADIMEQASQGAVVAPGDVEALIAALEALEMQPSEKQREDIRAWAAQYSVAKNVQASLDFIESCK